MKYKELIKIQDFFSLGNLAAGFISLIFIIQQRYDFVFALWIVAMVCDILDGKVAKARQSIHDFGKQLDSLADIVSFGVAPALYGYMLMQQPWSLVILLPFLFAGILRLARFNVQSDGTYVGMPITWNSPILVILGLLPVTTGFYPLIFIILAGLMVAPVTIRKVW